MKVVHLLLICLICSTQIVSEDRHRNNSIDDLKKQKSFTTNNCSYKVSSFFRGRQWYVDRNPGGVKIKEADKGNLYYQATLKVTTDLKETNLSSFGLYERDGEILKFIKYFEIRYQYWSSYGSYLGNYTDPRNDFSKKDRIKFNIGAEYLEKPKGKLYLIAHKKELVEEVKVRFNSPPKIFTNRNAQMKKELTVEDFNSEYVYVNKF